MNKLPWQENNLIYKFTKGDLIGVRIEEVREPWDLFLESCFLQTSFGEAFHVNAIQDNVEVIFSIRDDKREPIADILTMPVNAKRWDSYWPKVRVFKTSQPMTVNDRELIVLDVVSKDERRANKSCLEVAKMFYLGHKGILDNAHPNGLTLPEGKGLKKWKKIWRGAKDYNLCISSKVAYVHETQLQAFDMPKAIEMLSSGRFDEIYFNVDEPWIDRIMEHLKANRPDRPVKSFRFFGDPKRTNYYCKLIQQWKEEES